MLNKINLKEKDTFGMISFTEFKGTKQRNTKANWNHTLAENYRTEATIEEKWVESKEKKV